MPLPTSSALTGLRPALGAFGLLVAGALALALGGIALTGTKAHLYLVFNLFLALVPLGLAVLVSRLEARGRPPAAVVAASVAWLLFLPNAPYILTDFGHLRFTPTHWVWGHLVLLVWFSFTGLVSGLLSLRIMHHVAEARWGPGLGWTAVLAAAGLSGLGVALGRLQRWNTWDLLFHPWSILNDALRHVNPSTSPLDAVLSVGLGLFFATAYIFLRSVTPGAPTPRGSGAGTETAASRFTDPPRNP